MSRTLIVPAAGRSTRYGLSRPKFLLQHPTGVTMLSAGLAGLDGTGITRLVVVSLAEYFDGPRGVTAKHLTAEVERVTGVPTTVHLLDEPTTDPVETVIHGIGELAEDGPIVLKDTDNLVGLPDGWEQTTPGNFVTFADLAKFPEVTAANKSFLRVGMLGTVADIAEKQVISAHFNVGLVGFEAASLVVLARERLQGGREAYVSDVVGELIRLGYEFRGVEAGAYADWGTLADWRAYCATYATVLCDLDGVLCRNEHPLSETGWTRFDPITENIQALLERHQPSRTRFVFVTSRTEDYRPYVHDALVAAGFEQFDLVMSLPHARRILVNDFAGSAPYPTAVAINLPRNAPSLREYL
ncbi:MAG: hypothetical protein P8Z68_06625 [Kineosporiaceae bacterium]|jgi:hypothetical protein